MMTTNNNKITAPRAKVIINGVEFKYTSVNIQRANAALSSQITVVSPLYGYTFKYLDDFFSSTDEFIIDVQVDEIGNGTYKRLFYGQIDDYEDDAVDATFVLAGRDLSARLIDKKTTLRFQELPASEVAKILAQDSGLKAVVTDTTTPVGIYYGDTTNNLSIQRSEWDILSFLAQVESFDLYVKDDTLYFVDREKVKHNEYTINWINPTTEIQNVKIANVLSIEISRSFTLAKKLTVTVRSYNQFYDQTFTGVATRAQIVGKASQATQKYTVNIPNLTQEQTVRMAEAILEQITDKEVILNARVVGTTSIQVDTIVKLTGRSKIFDNYYYIDRLSHEITTENFITTFNCKNHSTLSTKVIT